MFDDFLEPNIQFEQKGLIANSGKNHFVVSPCEVRISDSSIKSSQSAKLLGIAIDSDLTFHEYAPHLCFKANQKLNTLLEY